MVLILSSCNGRTKVQTDVLVVGGGPHGLAVAARLLQEQATGMRYDALSDAHRSSLASAGASQQPLEPMRVRVLDEHGEWMSAWKNNFSAMRIPYLRSRVAAHPDPSDISALLDFAMANGREKEVPQHCDTGALPGGARGRRKQRIEQESLGSLHLFARPTSRLFIDFCDHLAASLGGVELIKGKALSLRTTGDGYIVTSSSCEIYTETIVLACGGLGCPRIPTWVSSPAVSKLPQVLHTSTLARQGAQALETLGDDPHGPAVVVGAGMSGCWIALALANRGRQVTLLARSGLRVQHYDTSHDWWGRAGNRKLCEFYACDAAGRAEMVRAARGGGHGTVTPELYKTVDEALSAGKLQLVEHDPVSSLCEKGLLLESGRLLNADAVVLATGMDTDCMASDFFRQAVQLVGGVDVYNGLPALGDDLRLDPDHQIFVSGALAALGAGPHAHNLQGARTCSRLIADALLHDKDNEDEEEVFQPRVLSNSYAALLAEPSDDSDEDDSEEYDSDEDDSDEDSDDGCDDC